ncbi:hypothetical protein MLD52_07300 [Puniceicoccaceae bacterium K14]|nr:hypothetical protein [Puniceicoccaceae bacterium K14]
MKYSIQVILTILCMAAFLPKLKAEEGEKVKWIYNYQEALEKACQTGQPIFLEFRCAP